MAIDFSSAVQAYDQAVRTGSNPGMEARDEKGGPDFVALLKEASENVVGSHDKAEFQTMKAANGTASLDEVVMAVTQAEMTLTAVVSIRDKVVQAYQEILRMPI